MTSFTGLRIDNADEVSPVAFHAHVTDNWANYLDGEIIVFDEVHVNYGGFYSPEDGVFVCPDDEVYFFCWSVAIDSERLQGAGEARLTMDGEEVKLGPRTSQILSQSYMGGGSSSTQAIVQCEEGRGITVQAVVSDSIIMRFQQRYSNFMGFRLPKI